MANIAALIYVIVLAVRQDGASLYNDSLTAASINLVVAVIGRQEHVINGLFLLSSSLPHSSPLWLRHRLAKVYNYGGLHSGCGVAAACWYLSFTILFSISTFEDHGRKIVKAIVLIVLTYSALLIIAVILVFAYPSVRARRHDQFEATHRFAGWTVVGLIVASIHVQTSKVSEDSHIDYGGLLIKTPAFWCTNIIICCLAYPWLRLRKRHVRAEKLSDHAARLYFDYATLDPCLSVRLSFNSLIQNHSFAAIPNVEETIPTEGNRVPTTVTKNGKGFSVMVSNAGDWTSDVIQNLPTRIWVRGVPVYGVPRVAVMFRRVLFVATGSGIGPCMSFFQGYLNADVRILWRTRDPVTTYGQEIVDAVTRADPHATIVNTSVEDPHRPSLMLSALEIFQREDCEVVIVISNKMVTENMTYYFESRGLPIFSPIFDS